MEDFKKTILRATATPLSSIFGSGFLVIVPILYGATGPWAVVAMAAVCGLAYCVGCVIRFNIREAEPLIDGGKAPRATRVVEDISDIALVLAYIISVCLYLRIFASFLLSSVGIDNDFNEQLITTGVICLIGAVALTKGLRALEILERWGLGVTLGIVVLLLASFAIFDVRAATGDGIQWPEAPAHSWWEILTIVGGTLIVVQGFETSRYLGESFDTETRVRSCRLSQLISTGVYLVFIAVATPLMHFLGGKVEDNGLLLLAGKAWVLLPIPLVVAAVLSQFSAAVADTLGGQGNMVEASNKKISPRVAYSIICCGAIVLAWTADTLQILALASRAFAFYYLLQCVVAITVSRNPGRKCIAALLALVLAFIAVFSVPAG